MDAIAKLTDRQKDCLRLVLTGRSAKEIGLELGLSGFTVENHLKAARKTLGVSDSGEAARRLHQNDRLTDQGLASQSTTLLNPPVSRQQVSQQQGGSDPVGQTSLLLQEHRQPFDALPEQPRFRDWFIRREGQEHNELTIRERLLAMAVLIPATIVGAALVLIAVTLLLMLLVSLARDGL